MIINPMLYTSLITGQRGIIEGLEAQAATETTIETSTVAPGRVVTTITVDTYEGPERRNVEALGRRLSDIPETLLGCSLVSAGQDASRYLQALEAGDTERLGRMLKTAIEVGALWKERLTK